MNTTTDQLDDILERAGVDFGKPEKRRERAVRLTNEGMSTAVLDELVAFAHTRCRRLHKVGTWIGWCTKDQPQWQACVTQLHKMRAEHAAKVPVAAERVRTPEEIEQYKRGMAYARCEVDHAPRDVVAAELGLAPSTLDEFIAEEKRRRQRAAEERKAGTPRPRAHVPSDEASDVW